jgi:hypothetical protein
MEIVGRRSTCEHRRDSATVDSKATIEATVVNRGGRDRHNGIGSENGCPAWRIVVRPGDTQRAAAVQRVELPRARAGKREFRSARSHRSRGKTPPGECEAWIRHFGRRELVLSPETQCGSFA